MSESVESRVGRAVADWVRAEAESKDYATACEWRNVADAIEAEAEDRLWLCEDCRALNGDHEAFCFRCGAGQPEAIDPSPSPAPPSGESRTPWCGRATHALLPWVCWPEPSGDRAVSGERKMRWRGDPCLDCHAERKRAEARGVEEHELPTLRAATHGDLCSQHFMAAPVERRAVEALSMPPGPVPFLGSCPDYPPVWLGGEAA